jgi:hypothetical protein
MQSTLKQYIKRELGNVPVIGLALALPVRTTACDGRGPAGPVAVSFGLFS